MRNDCNGKVVILSYRDKRTRDFAAGERVKAFSGLDRAGRMKLDRLEAAISVLDLSALPGQSFRDAEGRPKWAVQHSNQ